MCDPQRALPVSGAEAVALCSAAVVDLEIVVVVVRVALANVLLAHLELRHLELVGGEKDPKSSATLESSARCSTRQE